MKLAPLTVAALFSLLSTGAIAGGGPLDLSSGSTGFSSTPTSGVFTDVYTFTLASPAFVAASITAAVSGAQDVDFTSIAIAGPSGSFAFSSAMGDPFELWTLSSTQLTPGSYTLTLSGANSAAAGSYGGNIGVSPVPEPQTWLLLLAGLGTTGYLATRRNV